MSIHNSTFKSPAKPIKRSAFKRAAHKKELKAGAKTYRKPSVFRSPGYLAAVRTLDCVNCGRFRTYTQAAHSNQLVFGKSKSKKSSDASAMALCFLSGLGKPGCHETHDQGGKRTKAEWKALEHQWIVSTVLGLIAARKLTGDRETIAQVHAAFVASISGFESAAVLYVSLIESGMLWVAK